jgi:hypothetical protein
MHTYPVPLLLIIIIIVIIVTTVRKLLPVQVTFPDLPDR